MISKILDHLGDDILLAYDIGCAMDTTVRRSSLGEKFTRKNMQFCVPAFHAYTHNHVCQMQYHPNNIEGMGIEDVETLERVFSGSNHLAPVVRYMSAYRRRLYIEAYLKQWDEDKLVNTGIFILNNYTQSLDIIAQETAALASLKFQGISEEELAQWYEEEEAFFAQLGEEPPHDVHAVAYVESLQKLQQLEVKRKQLLQDFLQYDPETVSARTYNQHASDTQKLETQRRHVVDQIDRVSGEVCELEISLGISRGARWTPADEGYQRTLKYICERKYHRALMKLQKLVVMRLFELSKLNVAKTGE